MSGVLAILDGQVMPAGEATIPVTDDGLLRGDGVFEVVRALRRPAVRARRPPRAHGALGAPTCACELDLDAVARGRRGAARGRPAPGDASLRVLVTRGGRRIGLVEAAAASCAPSLALATVEYVPTRVLDGIKSLSYAREHARRRGSRRGAGADEALLVTPHGRVLEAPTSSFFFVAGRRDARARRRSSDHILDSITRRHAARRSSSVEERPVTRDDLRGAREAFLASTTREVQPVRAIDDARAAGGARAR